jgi:hypothetical protein
VAAVATCAHICAHICAQTSLPDRTNGSEEDVWTDGRALYGVDKDATVAETGHRGSLPAEVSKRQVLEDATALNQS